MKKLAAAMAAALYISVVSGAFADQPLGVANLEVDGPRPLGLTFWYPASGGKVETVGGNAVFQGTEARRDASLVGGPLPLVLVSHGGLRSAADTGGWLASGLAQRGFIAVEVNATRPRNAAEAVNEIWQRSADISRALDAILTEARWSGHIDQRRISVVGYALGGTAALALAGGRIDPTAFAQLCRAPYRGPDCGWFAAQGVTLDAVDKAHLSAPRKDKRIRSVVAISPEYVQAFSTRWAKGDIAILTMSLGTDLGDMTTINTRSAHAEIPQSTLFDGFQTCTSNGAQILADEGGNPLLCGSSVEARKQAHEVITEKTAAFLNQAAVED